VRAGKWLRRGSKVAFLVTVFIAVAIAGMAYEAVLTLDAYLADLVK